MSFKGIRFPTDISFGSTGGPAYSTTIISFKSGYEKRNLDWEYPRSSYDVAYGVRERSQLELLLDFFHVVQGRGYTFRYKDPLDYKSCKIDETVQATDQKIGTGDGSTTEFQIYKSYYKTSIDGSTNYSKSRKITKPVRATVVVAVDGTEVSNYTVDYTTGIITFDTAPADGAEITAGYEFDVHARFDTDEITIDMEAYLTASTEVPVVEVKD